MGKANMLMPFFKDKFGGRMLFTREVPHTLPEMIEVSIGKKKILYKLVKTHDGQMGYVPTQEEGHGTSVQVSIP